jgi:hypothetical protein
MATILPFIRPETAFDEFATSAMGVAFDAACVDLKDGERSNLLREVIAERIIEAAKRGERDPERLRSIALAAFRGERKTR